MASPFFIPTPGVIKFSGGRTSGKLLYEVLQAYDGKLPDDLRVIFNNTGKEDPRTLDFTDRCAREWGVHIWWVEFRPGWPGYEIVSHNSASREGEPFDMLLETPVDRKDGTHGVRPLPNPIASACTVNLKTRLTKRFVNREWGWTTYHCAIGMRADEGNRVASGLKYPEPGEILHYPLHDTGITKWDVLEFWKTQPFDLEIPTDKYGDTPEGNCDLCFKKGAGKIARMIAAAPEKADWWIRAEERAAATDRPGPFRQDRPTYREIRDAVANGGTVDFGLFDDLMTCGSNGCTD